MATQKDLEWLKSQGDRKKSDGGDFREPDLADKLKKHYEDAAAARATLAGLGIENAGESTLPDIVKKNYEEAAATRATMEGLGIGRLEGKGQAEQLATTIVTKSMESQEKFITRMNETTEELRQELLRTQKEREANLNRWLDSQLERIKDKQDTADKAAGEALEAGAPSKVFDTYRQVKDMLKEMLEEIHPNIKDRVSAGGDFHLAIELERLRQDNNLKLEQLRQEGIRSERDFRIKILEIENANKLKWAEYADKRDFRKEGFEGFQDITKAIAEAISKERGGTPSPSPELSASIAEFPCEKCHTAVPVEEGAQMAICPNAECGMKYKVEAKG